MSSAFLKNVCALLLDIWLYDFSDGSEIAIEDNDEAQLYPRIHGDVIVWQDKRHNVPDATPDEMFDEIYVRVLP